MVTIRKLTQDEYEAFYQLSLYAFRLKDTDERKQNMFRQLEHSDAYGVFNEGTLKSGLMVMPYNVYYDGNVLKMSGIAYVGSYPEVRGQGGIRGMFERALEEMRSQGSVLSYLAPFSYRFYRKFGYEIVFEDRSYDLKARDFGSFRSPETTADRVLWQEEKDALKEIYHTKMTKAVGPLKRQDWVWEESVMSSADKKIALYKDSDGDPKGYMIYAFTGKDQDTFQIHELMALTGEAERALWQFVGTHAASFETFKFKTRTDQRLTHLFDEAYLNQTLSSSMMARIVDMESFLKQLPMKTTKNQNFWLEVTDDTAQWNNRIFKVSLSDHGAHVSAEEKVEEPERLLKADIRTWTQVFMCFKKASTLRFEGSLAASEQTVKDFQDILPDRVPELYDYF